MCTLSLLHLRYFYLRYLPPATVGSLSDMDNLSSNKTSSFLHQTEAQIMTGDREASTVGSQGCGNSFSEVRKLLSKLSFTMAWLFPRLD